jgi:cation transport ATPase
MGASMDSPTTSYLYTVAIISMSFTGFAAVVMLLRQTLRSRLRVFDALFARVYMEFGLIATIGAMLPPLLMFWELPPAAVWRVSSSILGIPLLVFVLTYPARRRAATNEPTPRYVQANLVILLVISLTLLLAAAGVLHEQSGRIFLTALTVFLTFAVGTWLRTLKLILVPDQAGVPNRRRART